MKVSAKYWQSSIALVMVVVALIMPTSTAFTWTSNPVIFPPKAHPYGLTYGEWNARWWQWFFSVPASENPGLAKGGKVDCSVGQSGDVWFLSGYFNGSGKFTYNCTIPAGKALLIPLINSWADNVCNNPPLTIHQLRQITANAVFPPKELHASVDGHSFTHLGSYRAVSPVFSYTLPPSPDNVLDAVFGISLPGLCWPSLTVYPAVADGFYIMLRPLTPGLHTIKFGGTGNGFFENITYKLTVK
jgi:hypothetical protein